MNQAADKRTIYFIISLAFLARVISIFVIGDYKTPEMWEFGMIARNLLNGEGFTYIAQTINVPSAYMPPGLPYIYYFIFLLIGDNSAAYLTILFLNCLLGAVSVHILYILAEKLYNKKTALYTAIYAAVSPIIIFSTVNFNSVVIYHVLIVFMFLYFVQVFQKSAIDGEPRKAFKYTLLLAIISGLFMYFRSEMLGFTILVFSCFMFSRKFKPGLLYIITALIIISPWTIRNYETFGKFVPITTTFGYNMLMGHAGEEPTGEYETTVKALQQDSTYEIRVSDISLKIALDYIKAHPSHELKVAAEKVYSLWLIDIYREQARHPLYLMIWLPTIALFLYGLYLSLRDKEIKHKLFFLNMYLIFSTLLVIVFFNIPRYQIQMSFVMLPTAMYGLTNIINQFTKKADKHEFQ